ncbi:MAG: OmpA family protein [Phycisphaerales bacterium]|nr:OmpA family protein [Phycisphaerales bacterium]
MRTTHFLRPTKRLAMTTTILAIAGISTGCVSQQEYDKLWETNRSLTNRNSTLQSQLDGSSASNTQLQGSAGDAQSVIDQLNNDNQALRGQLSSSQTAYGRLEDRLSSMQMVHIDPATDRALNDLADQYPDLIIYDADHGMLRFASDLTFGSGSDVVQSGAADSLKTLAGVLNAGAANNYDIQIVGHTDNQKISSGTAKRHPSNMHLAAHRAISVRKALGNAGVDWNRMESAGWGEYRPLVANNAGKGTAANRRVEIFLVPSTITDIPTTSSTAVEIMPSEVVPTRPRVDVDPMK